MAIKLILGIAPFTPVIWVLTPVLQTCDLYFVCKMLFIYVCVHIVYIKFPVILPRVCWGPSNAQELPGCLSIYDLWIKVGLKVIKGWVRKRVHATASLAWLIPVLQSMLKPPHKLFFSAEGLQAVVKSMRSSCVRVRAQAALIPSAFPNGFLSNVTTLVQCWKKGHQGWQIMIFKSKQNPWVGEMLLLLKKSPHAPPQPGNKRGHWTVLYWMMLSCRSHGQRWSRSSSTLLQGAKTDTTAWQKFNNDHPTLDRFLIFSE